MLKKLVSRMVSLFTAAAMAGTMAAFTTVSAHGAEAEEESFDQKINEIAIMVNEVRAEYGLKAVYVLPELCEAASVRAAESVESFCHERMDGSSFATAIDSDMIPFTYAAENLAAGNSSAEITFNQWRNSPKHWAAILDPNITHMGIGIVYDADAEYHYYWQQTFVTVDKSFADQYLPTDKEIVPDSEGDITGDSVVDSYDYIALTEYLTKKKNNIPAYLNPAQLEAADCFRDGMITESDAKVMVRYLLGEYKSLPFCYNRAHLKTPSKQEHKRHGTKKAIFIPKRSKYRLK